MRALNSMVLLVVALVTVHGPAVQAEDDPKLAEVLRMPHDCLFFDPQSSRITPEGTDVVRVAVEKIAAAHALTVTVTGHTDLIEAQMDSHNRLSPQNAIDLSGARAAAVRAAMLANGLPNGITVNAVAQGATPAMIREVLSPEALKAMASRNDEDREGYSGEPMNRAACIAF
jgi:outer membrane protein OmpA-like peptidoglycan-associated protein